jgi:hypothetical protein
MARFRSASITSAKVRAHVSVRNPDAAETIMLPTCTTGNPDQFSTCSPSQCCRCWGESVISIRLICETESWEMLASRDRDIPRIPRGQPRPRPG